MNIAAILADPEYPELKNYILDQTGLAYYADKDEDLAARVSRRFAVIDVPDCGSYLQILIAEAPRRTEMHQLVGELTIGETYFFRQREHFDLMRERILPDLLERNQFTRRLRIWSAGCATGPEPYSVALLLHREFQKRIEGWDVSILATDINIEFLARAREARFGAWALRETSAAMKAACFLQDGKDWVLRPEYRKGVTFEYHNLASEMNPAADGEPFDLIVCRNVIIYFSPERMRSVIDNFYRCLNVGGWLIVGHAEPNLEMFHSFELVSDLNATAYRKNAKTAADSASSFFDWQTFEEKFAVQTPAAEAIRVNLNPLFPEPPAPSMEEARMLADSGNWEAATQLTRKLIETDALNATAYFMLGLIQEHAGASEEARAAFRRAIYLDRGFALAHYHLGASLKGNREWEMARKAFRNVLQILDGSRGEEPVPQGDGITTGELCELARMHLDLMGPHSRSSSESQ
jgi:chemotaxis protein methyltransferase CheR